MGIRVRRTKNQPTWAAFAGMDTRVSERRKSPGQGRIQFDSRLCLQEGARLCVPLNCS